MRFKYFDDAQTRQSVAVNPEAVKYVMEVPSGIKVFFIDGTYLIVNGNLLETVSRLSEK
jgi:hypothetical protein